MKFIEADIVNGGVQIFKLKISHNFFNQYHFYKI